LPALGQRGIRIDRGKERKTAAAPELARQCDCLGGIAQILRVDSERYTLGTKSTSYRVQALEPTLIE
jgi:hypothetical protein